MRPLTVGEKVTYTSQLKKFIKAVNIIGRSIGIEVKQVTYMIPIDDDYFYFDYPWSKKTDKTLEELNKLLDDNSQEITKNTISVLKEYSIYNEKNKDNYGYIFYEYLLTTEGGYSVSNIDSPFLSKDNQQALLDYLPLIHFGCYLEGGYYIENVPFEPAKVGTEKLLTIYKTLNVNSNKSDDDNTIVCSFICENEFQLNENTKQIISSILVLIEGYFDSPILNKLFKHHRRSYILGYKHNLDNLYLKSEAELINDLPEDIPEDTKLDINRIREKLKIIDLTHSFIFDYECIDSNLNYKLRFENYSIQKLLHTYFDIIPEYAKLSLLTGKSDYLLKRLDAFGNYMLTDICLVIWNLWNNACSNSGGQKVDIEIFSKSSKIEVWFSNQVKMPKEMIEYIKDSIKNHPHEEKRDRPYRGWTIIKDIIKQNKKLSIDWEFDIPTIIKLKILR